MYIYMIYVCIYTIYTHIQYLYIYIYVYINIYIYILIMYIYNRAKLRTLQTGVTVGHQPRSRGPLATWGALGSLEKVIGPTLHHVLTPKFRDLKIQPPRCQQLESTTDVPGDLKGQSSGPAAAQAASKLVEQCSANILGCPLNSVEDSDHPASCDMYCSCLPPTWSGVDGWSSKL